MNGNAVFAAGTYVDPGTDNSNVLILKDVRGAWRVDPAPDPGTGSNILGGVTDIDGQLWVAGIFDNGGSEMPLIEHRAAG